MSLHQDGKCQAKAEMTLSGDCIFRGTKNLLSEQPHVNHCVQLTGFKDLYTAVHFNFLF